jgi:hypothetical protein
VPHLCHHVRGIAAGGQEDRRERAPQRVRRELRQRGAAGVDKRVGRALSGALHGALAHVVLVARPAERRGEHVFLAERPGIGGLARDDDERSGPRSRPAASCARIAAATRSELGSRLRRMTVGVT